MCTNQDGNTEKCLKSTKTCEQGQDACFTEIKWGSKFKVLFNRPYLTIEVMFTSCYAMPPIPFIVIISPFRHALLVARCEKTVLRL